MTAQGGLAERLLGSCLLAVFGVNELHEDDALRCVRAARDARTFAADFSQNAGTSLGVRIGICAATVTGFDPASGLQDSRPSTRC